VWRRAVKPMFDRNKWKILRGDEVMIMTGKDKGQIGTVRKVIRDERFPRVVVDGLNLVCCGGRLHHLFCGCQKHALELTTSLVRVE